MDVLCQRMSHALDVIEKEILGVSEHHSMRIAALCATLGRKLGFSDDALSALTTCALFHDNALTEYILSEKPNAQQQRNIRVHCELGERNVKFLPFKENVNGFVLYHHEKSDGTGPFGKKEGEYPFQAALISMLDMLDVARPFQRLSTADLPDLRRRVADMAGLSAPREAAEAFVEALNEETLLSLRDDRIENTIAEAVPAWNVADDDPAIIGISSVIARIIDYKSVFTRKHTVQIANRTWVMSNYYDFDEVTKTKLYLAAALHDIGKTATPAEILEKPGQLTREEFQVIKQHVRDTYDWLHDVPGLEDICRWASGHHEKLDGNGYPFGKKADEQDFNSRLLACLDIYQAVREERPYHPARTHDEAMAILCQVAKKGQIDEKIVEDIGVVMGRYTNEDIPTPCAADAK
jgi:HD-GYP domain-containing protein (c-di-GMP phosphodiesterase class II)